MFDVLKVTVLVKHAIKSRSGTTIAHKAKLSRWRIIRTIPGHENSKKYTIAYI